MLKHEKHEQWNSSQDGKVWANVRGDLLTFSDEWAVRLREIQTRETSRMGDLWIKVRIEYTV